MKKDTAQQGRIKPAVFHILLALSEDDRHGLGIADEVEEVTAGEIQLGPGTLYRSLKEMAGDGLIVEVAAPSEDDDPRRKYYRITEAGRELLAVEAARYERIVRVARKRKVLSETL